MRNGILALLALGLITSASSAQGWAEKMFKESLTHDFGTVARGTQLVHKFTMTNIYAVRMEITSLKSGCGCVTASAPKKFLEPRESMTIEVRMDARRFTGPKTVGVRVTVGPEFVSSAELKVTANSRSDVVFNPGQVSFGTVSQGQTPTQTVDVEYAGALHWEVTEVIARDLPYEVAFKELYRRPGQVGYQIKATLKADAPVGIHKHDLFLKTNDPAAPVVPVLVEANVQTTVSVLPSALNLGSIKADAPQTRRVVVRGQKPFHVLSVEGLGTGVELSGPLAVTDAAVQTIAFTVKPAEAGEFKRELKIKTTLQDTPVVVTIDAVVAK